MLANEGPQIRLNLFDVPDTALCIFLRAPCSQQTTNGQTNQQTDQPMDQPMDQHMEGHTLIQICGSPLKIVLGTCQNLDFFDISVTSIIIVDSIESTSMTFTLKAYCSTYFIQKASANQFTDNLNHLLKY